jgi:putative transposase
VAYYVLFVIHLESSRIDIAGTTVHRNEQWMQQVARNATIEGCSALRDCQYLLHDRAANYCAPFRAIIETGRVKTLVLLARSLNPNAYGEEWIRSAKEECFSGGVASSAARICCALP